MEGELDYGLNEELEENVSAEEVEEKKVVNIEDFFTEDTEKEGVWFEPVIGGEGCGIEFLVTGAGADSNLIENERYEKAMAEAEKIKDQIEKTKKKKEIDAKRVASIVKGIRNKEGYEGKFGGKPLEYSAPFVYQIMLHSPLIKAEIVKFSIRTTNFIKREKKN